MIVYIMAALLVVLIVLFVVNVRLSEGRLHRIAAAVNVLLFALIAAEAALGFVNYRINKSEADDHVSISGLAILGSTNYLRTEDGYHLFSQSAFLSPPTEYAVPEEQLKLPVITKLYSPVVVYFGEYESADDVELSDGDYPVWSNAELVRPDLVPFAVIAVLITAGVLFIADLIIFIIVMNKRGEKAGQQP